MRGRIYQPPDPFFFFQTGDSNPIAQCLLVDHLAVTEASRRLQEAPNRWEIKLGGLEKAGSPRQFCSGASWIVFANSARPKRVL